MTSKSWRWRPPDMPAALYANAVDAYCTGEPFGAAAQQAGYARPLRMTRDEWRNYICCVLTVREELILARPAMVQDLVNQVLGAGVWLDQQQENRNKAVAIAAGRDFFNQDPKILQFVMENPVDRVTYGDLRMIDSRNAGNRYDLVIAGMIIIGLIGLMLDGVMRLLEGLKAVRWRYAH